MTKLVCRICGERYDHTEEDDAIIHVDDCHTLREQIGTCVTHEDGFYVVPMDEESYSSEYSARTAVMRGTSVERLRGCLRDIHMDDTEESTGGVGETNMVRKLQQLLR